ncbi:MAG: cadmium-translocating P-type ATPase [Bacteroidales bacterium]|nr:cadmium-translocating P-type ATPase [Bacteroidales bacterium]
MCKHCHTSKDTESHSHSHSHDHKHCHSHNHSHHHENESCGSGSACGCSHHHHEKEEHANFFTTYAKELLTGLLLVGGLILSHFIPSQLWWIYYIAAVLPVGLPILKEMFESWREGSVMNEFTLMVAATVGAFLIGEYPEGVAVLLFYSFGEKMEDTASEDVKKRIKSLLGRLPETARLKEDENLRTVNPSDLKIGDIIMVNPGERIPVDAILTGNRDIDFDTSAITGESVPRTFHPGDELSSGMIPVNRAVELRTSRLFSDSSMTRVMKMIEEAQESKSPTENMLRRITRWYTPVVFTAALLLFFIPWIIAGAQGVSFEWMKWLRRSLIFLVCSCPCALVVSIPLSYFASLGNASRRGLLFKGSKFVDAMRDVKTVMLDKTGTLTTGKFHVSAVSSDGKDEKVIAFAAALDRESAHPLAIAIVEYAKEKNLNDVEATDVETVSHGMSAIIDGKICLVGSRSLMRSHDIALPDTTSDASEICVAYDGEYLGSIYLLDTVKPEAREAIARLHELGVESVEILSGDHEAAVSRVMKEVGADAFHASLLPEDKQRIINERRENTSGKVAFVGDGINDAPAIAASDVGVAMGTLGTDLAMESSDVVIAGDNLTKLPEAISLGRKVRRVVTENVTFAMGVKALVMTLGAFGIASLWAAVFADTGVTLITILWTLIRLRK